MTPVLLTRLNTPIGPVLLIAANAKAPLSVLEFEDQPHRLQRALLRHHGPHILHPGPSPHTAPLLAYFAGQLTALDAIPCMDHGTPFQRRTWSALRAIPPGAPIHYAALARQIGHPTAIRAVGAANGANPLAIVIPCHRLIGRNGALTGYGGGVARKAWLLAHERRYAADQT